MAGYNGYPTLEALKSAIEAGTEPAAKWTRTFEVGKNHPEKMGTMHSLSGFSNVSSANLDPTLPAWTPRTLGYDNEGDMFSPTRGPFVIGGLRSKSSPMAPIVAYPSVLSAGYLPATSPTAGASFKVFDETLFREMIYSCGECTQETLHDTVKVITYKMDAANGYLKKNGELDPLGTCALTLSCDFGSPMPSSWATPFGIVTLPYFGGGVPDFASNAIIITDKATGAARVYDETTMKNEIAVEPFSGTTTKLSTSLQINAIGVNAQTFNGGLYANVFSSGAFFPALWPVHASIDTFIESEENVKLFHGARNTVYMMMIVLDATAIFDLILCATCLWQARRLLARTRKCEPGSSDCAGKDLPDAGPMSA